MSPTPTPPPTGSYVLDYRDRVEAALRVRTTARVTVALHATDAAEDPPRADWLVHVTIGGWETRVPMWDWALRQMATDSIGQQAAQLLTDWRAATLGQPSDTPQFGQPKPPLGPLQWLPGPRLDAQVRVFTDRDGLDSGDLLTDALAYMARHGSGVTLGWDEARTEWECCWLTGGSRHRGTADSTNPALAVYRALLTGLHVQP